MSSWWSRRRTTPSSSGSWPTSGTEELDDRARDLVDVGLKREVAGGHEPDVGVRDIALERLRARRDEERVVASPDREQRRLAGAEVLLPGRVQGHVAGVVEEQVELDLV